MIKIVPKIFMINSLFCLRQHFSVVTSLIFIQNFGNCSFVCNNWTVYCPRIHYDLFKSNWVLPSKYQKIMVSLLFVFCWCMHIFLMIQIFTEKHLSNIWTADHLNMFTPHFVAFWEIYIGITYWLPVSIPKTSNGVEWDWMMPHDIFYSSQPEWGKIRKKLDPLWNYWLLLQHIFYIIATQKGKPGKYFLGARVLVPKCPSPKQPAYFTESLN